MASENTSLVAAVHALKLEAPDLGVKKIVERLKAQGFADLTAKQVRDVPSPPRPEEPTAPPATTPSRKHECCGCGAVEADGEVFSACQRCKDEKLPPSYYCGQACQKEHWPTHRLWHMKEAANSKERAEMNDMNAFAREARAET